MSLQIWIDADACPNVVKDILFRTAERRQLTLILVANRFIATPPSQFIKAIRVGSGLDVADSYIVQNCQPNDLVITADIPLDPELDSKQAFALNPRGELYTRETIHEHLSMLDFIAELRDYRQASCIHAAFGAQDKQAFANALDRFLAKQVRTNEILSFSGKRRQNEHRTDHSAYIGSSGHCIGDHGYLGTNEISAPVCST